MRALTYLCLAVAALTFVAMQFSNTATGVTATGAALVPPQRTFMVELDDPRANASTMFTGSCLVIDPSGSSSQQTESGVTPDAFTYSAASVSCSFQINNVNGELSLVIKRDGQILKRVDTQAQFGVVSAAVDVNSPLPVSPPASQHTVSQSSVPTQAVHSKSNGICADPDKVLTGAGCVSTR